MCKNKSQYNQLSYTNNYYYCHYYCIIQIEIDPTFYEPDATIQKKRTHNFSITIKLIILLIHSMWHLCCGVYVAESLTMQVAFFHKRIWVSLLYVFNYSRRLRAQFTQVWNQNWSNILTAVSESQPGNLVRLSLLIANQNVPERTSRSLNISVLSSFIYVSSSCVFIGIDLESVTNVSQTQC